MKGFLLLSALFCCHPATDAQKRYYTPAAYQISAHDKKGQLSISIARGNGYDANVSYSVFNNTCILLAYGENKRYEQRTTIFDPYGIQNNNTYKTLRIGYFNNLKTAVITRYEIYLGYAHSTIDNYWSFLEFDPQYAQYAKANYNSILIGGDGVFDTRVFECSATVRFAFYKYGSFTFYDKHPYNYYPVSHVDGLKGTNLELISGTGVKYKGFKLLLQAGLSLPVSRPLANQTDISTTNMGTYVVEHKESFQQGSFIFRIGIQFTSGYKHVK